MMATIKEDARSNSDSADSSANSEDDENASDEDVSDDTDDEKDEAEESDNDGLQKKGAEENTLLFKQYPLTFVCNALSDYSAKEDGELSFEKDEMLTVTSVRKDGWWLAKNSENMQGLVPSTFLKVPEQMNSLVNELLQSKDKKDSHFWSHLRSSLRKASALNTALQTFASVGCPLGFRDSLLGTLLKEDPSCKPDASIFPKLNESGLSFEDINWESVQPSDGKMTMQLKPFNVAIEKVVQLVALRQIIPPPPGYKVTSRYVYSCLHDGNKVQSNIHITKVIWDPKNPKIWLFNSKIPVDGSSLEEGQIFIRSHKSFATLGILFELCVAYEKDDSSEIGEMSCGWAFMRLLNDSGVPIKSKTKILKVHNSVPFTNYQDASAASLNSLQKLMNRSKQSRMVITVSNPKRSSNQHISYLPSTLIGSVSNIPLVALYRKAISKELLQRPSFDNNELIHSPFLHNFPCIFNEPDLVDFFRCVWTERHKKEKSRGMKKENQKLEAFRSCFMESAFLVMNSHSLPPFILGNKTYEEERKAKFQKLRVAVNAKGAQTLALSRELVFKPLTIEMLATYIVR